MALQITVTFPCSNEEYKKTLIVLNALQKSDFTTQPIKPTASCKPKQDESLIDEMSEDEKNILDLQLTSAHQSDNTPVLDVFKSANIRPLKINRSREIIKYVSEHPGTGRYDCAEYLATKLADYYPSFAIAKRRLGNMVSSLAFKGVLINRSSNPCEGSYFVA